MMNILQKSLTITFLAASIFISGLNVDFVGAQNTSLKDPALVIPRGDLLCWQFIDLLKSQISNYKLQTNSNDRNSKIQTMSRPGRFWSLNIGI